MAVTTVNPQRLTDSTSTDAPTRRDQSSSPSSARRLGPYTVETLLGRGAAGAVYRARDEKSQKIALKVLAPSGDSQVGFRTSFAREAEALSRLSHPNIVQLFDSGTVDGRTFIAMEFLSGKTLDKQLEANETLAEKQAVAVSRQIADALVHAHEHGIVHRDVKPANIIVLHDGTAKLTDFGVALLDSAEESPGDVDAVYGTPGYLAPEQAQSEVAVDGRADLYSLGVVLYRMVTGRKPFYGSRDQVLAAHIRQAPPPPSEVAHVSEGLEAVILKAIAKDPAERYQTGVEFITALNGVPLDESKEPRGFLQRLLHWR